MADDSNARRSRRPADPRGTEHRVRKRSGKRKRPEERSRDADEHAAAMLGLGDDDGSDAEDAAAGGEETSSPILDEQTPGGLRAIPTKNRPPTAAEPPPPQSPAQSPPAEPPGEPAGTPPPPAPPAPKRGLTPRSEARATAKPARARPKSAKSAPAERPAAEPPVPARRAAKADPKPPRVEAPAPAPAAVKKPRRPIVDRGRRVPVAGVITLAAVVVAGGFQYWNYERMASPDALVDARSDLAAVRGRVASLEATLSNNVNPDSRAKKLGALNKATGELGRAESVEREAAAEFGVGLNELADHWRSGGFAEWVEVYFVILGAALIPSPEVAELTATFGFFANETGRGTETGVVFVGIVASLGWATAGLMLALLARWAVRVPLWKSVGRPPFGAWDAALGVEAPWVAGCLRMVPFLPSWPLDLVAGVMPVSKLKLFLMLFLGSLVPSMLAAFVGVDAPSLLAVRIGEATPSTNAFLYCSVAGLGLLAVRLTLSPVVRGGVDALHKIADDSDAPTIEDAIRDTSDLDGEEYEGERKFRGGDRRRGR